MVILLNGYPRSGKDTLGEHLAAVMLKNFGLMVEHISTVDYVKDVCAEITGEPRDTKKDGARDDAYRMLLSSVKQSLSDYGDIPNLKVIHQATFSMYDITIIDVREPYNIEILKNSFPYCMTVCVDRKTGKEFATSSDSQVYDYEYDMYIDNNKSLEMFKKGIETLAGYIKKTYFC